MTEAESKRVRELRVAVLQQAEEALRACAKVLERAAKALTEDES